MCSIWDLVAGSDGVDICVGYGVWIFMVDIWYLMYAHDGLDICITLSLDTPYSDLPSLRVPLAKQTRESGFRTTPG